MWIKNLVLIGIIVSHLGCGPATATGPIKLTEKVCAEMAAKKYPRGTYPKKVAEAVLTAKEHYYRYLMNLEMADLTKEVKDNFEDAVEKAEERFDNEEENISQSDILKLKLGLVGVSKDLNETRKEMKKVRLELLHDLGIGSRAPVQFPEQGLTIKKLKIPSIKESLETARKNRSPFSDTDVKIAHITLLGMEEEIKLMKKGRKYARGLLMIALANFDMGIGEGKDLFEALYIYSRSVRDYVKGVYRFNMAVAKLSSVAGQELG